MNVHIKPVVNIKLKLLKSSQSIVRPKRNRNNEIAVLNLLKYPNTVNIFKIGHRINLTKPKINLNNQNLFNCAIQILIIVLSRFINILKAKVPVFIVFTGIVLAIFGRTLALAVALTFEANCFC